jgi:hypothetical protein
VEIRPSVIAAVVLQLARGIEASRLSCAAVSSCVAETGMTGVVGVEEDASDSRIVVGMM